MAKKTVYELIKRQNGETFAQTIRSFDSGIFDVPNLQRIVKYAGNCSDPLLDFLSHRLQFHGDFTSLIAFVFVDLCQ